MGFKNRLIEPENISCHFYLTVFPRGVDRYKCIIKYVYKKYWKLAESLTKRLLADFLPFSQVVGVGISAICSM